MSTNSETRSLDKRFFPGRLIDVIDSIGSSRTAGRVRTTGSSRKAGPSGVSRKYKAAGASRKVKSARPAFSSQSFAAAEGTIRMTGGRVFDAGNRLAERLRTGDIFPRHTRKVTIMILVSVINLVMIIAILTMQSPGAKKSKQLEDTVPPVIGVSSEFYVLTGADVNVRQMIRKSITDDSGKVKTKVKGKCSTETPGVYEFTVAATDASNNKVEQTVKVTVTDASELPKDCEFLTKNGTLAKRKGGVTTINGFTIVNKTYSVPKKYGDGMTKETKKAFAEMKEAAAKDGIDLNIVSGYRSYSTQKGLFSAYCNKDGEEKASTYSARAGHSEHQLGEAMDLNEISSSFADTEECKWLNEHAYEYGFILRYPEGKEEITGYIWEPWHFRYAGKDLAAELYNDGDWITVEEYFGIDS